MSTQILEALPTSRPKIKDNDRDSSITRFAVVLPILMALLLALVPVLGSAAKFPFLLVLCLLSSGRLFGTRNGRSTSISPGAGWTGPSEACLAAAQFSSSPATSSWD